MGSELNVHKISDLALDATVGFVGSMSSLFVDEGVPLLRGQNIHPYRLDLTNLKYISQETHAKWKKSSLRAGDVAIVRVGEPGTACVIPEEIGDLNAASLVIIRPDPTKLDSNYLCFYLNSPLGKHEISGRLVGSVQQVLNVKTAADLEIDLPPLTEQKAIAHILGTLNDKIELNRRMNATLEGMAQALFKSWFVDFDPVIDNALAAGNPIPDELAPRAEVRRQALELNAPSLSAEASAKAGFPAAFQFTEELGWIPEGWKTGKITDLADLNSESWSNKSHPDHVNYVDLANTKNGRINEVSPYEYTEAPSRARRVLRGDDTIIGTVRPGNRSFAYINEDGLTGSTGFAVLRPKLEACRSYVYLCLTQDDVIDHFAHLADGGAYPAIRPEVVGNLDTVTFPQELIELFDQKAYPLIEKIGQHQRASEILTKLRDTLLPKLISGELRTNKVEKLAEDSIA